MKRTALIIAIFIVAINIGCFSGSETPPDYSKWESKKGFSVEKLCGKNFVMFRTAFRNAQHNEIIEIALWPILIDGEEATKEEIESAGKRSEWWLMVAKKIDDDNLQAITYKREKVLFISKWSLIDNRTIRRAKDYSDYINFMSSLAEKELCSNDLVASVHH